MDYWGYHLIVDAGGCDIKKIKSKKNVEAFAVELVKAIDMVAYGKPQVVNFGSGNKEGFTLVQLIETSNITGHFCNENGAAYIDVFSCKPFEQDVAVATIQKFFGPKKYNITYIERNAPEV
jgi:S-adenosylmethionine decarboxylase